MTRKTTLLGGVPARKRKVTASTSTYAPNGSELEFEKSGTDLKEQGVAFELTVPDGFEGGSTHFRNVDKEPSEDPRAARLEAAARLQANTDQLNTGTIPNDVNPAEGYIPENGVNDEGQGKGMGAGDGGDPPPQIIPPMDGSTSAPSQATDVGPDLQKNETDIPAPFGQVANAEDRSIDLTALNAEGIAENTITNIGPRVDTGAILLDVDDVPDDSVEDVVLAVHAKRLMAIRASRIIATLDEDGAREAQIENLYLTDEFDEAVTTELARMGLRAGLQNLGFTLARVDISNDKAVQARVQASLAGAQSNLDKLHLTRTQAFSQSMAIASVGTNRKFFKGYENVLQESLVASLQSAGVRGARSLVAAVFAKHGVQYAATLNQIANTLCELPQEQRDGIAATLDLVDDQGQYEDEAAIIPIGVGNDDLEAGIDTDVGDDGFLPASLTAALARPGQSMGGFSRETTRLNASLSNKTEDRRNLILEAQRILARG